MQVSFLKYVYSISTFCNYASTATSTDYIKLRINLRAALAGELAGECGIEQEGPNQIPAFIPVNELIGCCVTVNEYNLTRLLFYSKYVERRLFASWSDLQALKVTQCGKSSHY
jgi:hypothetical protein